MQSYPQGRAHSQEDEETETDQVGALEKPSMRKPGQGRRHSLLRLFFATGIQEGEHEAGFTERTYVLFSKSREFTCQCVAFAQSGVSCSDTIFSFLCILARQEGVSKSQEVPGPETP